MCKKCKYIFKHFKKKLKRSYYQHKLKLYEGDIQETENNERSYWKKEKYM